MSYFDAVLQDDIHDLNISTDGPDTPSRLICKHQLDVHHHIKQGKVSVWHPTILDRVTTRYADHGGAEAALEWAVMKVVEMLETNA